MAGHDPSLKKRRAQAASHTDGGNRSGSMDAQLRFAIANKRLIELGYHGTLRVAEPHDYGVQKGATRLLIYQLRSSGPTRRTSVSGWKLLSLSKIDGCTVLDETFLGSRGRSHQSHYVWDVVYARVT
ncbi:MAG: hypothetical protein LC791_16555 [Acidobacteria bacterium]|nr:hypothetical protein [Acidobacteriota bacterium]